MFRRFIHRFTFVRRNVRYVYVGPARRNDLTNFTNATAIAAIFLPLGLQPLLGLSILDLLHGAGFWLYLIYAGLSGSFVALTYLYGFRLITLKTAYLSVLPFYLFYHFWLQGNFVFAIAPWSEQPAHKLGIILTIIGYLFCVFDLIRNGGHDVVRKGLWEKVPNDIGDIRPTE